MTGTLLRFAVHRDADVGQALATLALDGHGHGVRLPDVGAGGHREMELRKPAKSSGPITRIFNKLNVEKRLGSKVAMELIQADVALTVNEYAMARLGAAFAGLFLGLLISQNLLVALPLAILGFQVPVVLVQRRRRQRQQRFQEQLVDILSMLVSGLRAGVGLVQAMDLVRMEMPAPAGQEFGTVVREIGLGVPASEALRHLTERMPGDDLAMVVTVINVQAEVGGNLATILDGVITTIRERVRLVQEVRTITSQQRMTGYLLAVLPFLVGLAVMLLSPGYLTPLFTLKWAWLPGAAVAMMAIGFVFIRRIVDIKV